MKELLLPVSLFALSMCITPGPNNMMLTASGANFGFRRTIPHILGIEFGLLLMFALNAAGLGLAFKTFPILQSMLKIVSVGYLFYLAIRIAFSKPVKISTNTQAKPLSFLEAAAFQMVNPKVLMMALTAMSTFSIAGNHYNLSVSLIIAIFGLVCIPSIALWAGFGVLIGRTLKGRKSHTAFNLLMSGLTAGSVILIV
nr:LysE family translocator [uncultured Desulfobacter sp.]